MVTGTKRPRETSPLETSPVSGASVAQIQVLQDDSKGHVVEGRSVYHMMKPRYTLEN